MTEESAEEEQPTVRSSENGGSGVSRSDRRGFVRKIVGIAAAGGLASVLLRQQDSLLPLAQAASGGTMIINATNDGEMGSTVLLSNTSGATFDVANQSTSGVTYGVLGYTASAAGRGVRGFAGNTSGRCIGVEGESNSDSGVGVYGFVGYFASGSTVGVLGQSDSVNGIGVQGTGWNGSGNNCGVYGESQSAQGTGVYGTGGYGVTGVKGESPGGFGVLGVSDVNLSGYFTQGVVGLTDGLPPPGPAPIGVQGAAINGVGVQGTSMSGGIGVLGMSWGDPGGKPFAARGWLFQTANLQEWQDIFGNPLSVVNASGSLGVGTANPSDLFHGYSNTDAVIRLVGDGTGSAFSFEEYYPGVGGPGLYIKSARGSFGSPANLQVGDRMGQVIFTGFAGGGFRNVAGIEGWIDAGTVSSTSLPSYLAFKTTPNGSIARTERMRIDENGNVGVGTATPTNRLHVNAGMSTAMRVDGATASSASAGAGTLPSNPVGFLVVNIGGTDRKIPYYA